MPPDGRRTRIRLRNAIRWLDIPDHDQPNSRHSFRMDCRTPMRLGSDQSPKDWRDGCRPVPDRHHYGVLIHGEFGAKRKVKAPLPRVAEAVRPLAGSAVSFVPNVLL